MSTPTNRADDEESTAMRWAEGLAIAFAPLIFLAGLIHFWDDGRGLLARVIGAEAATAAPAWLVGGGVGVIALACLLEKMFGPPPPSPRPESERDRLFRRGSGDDGDDLDFDLD